MFSVNRVEEAKLADNLSNVDTVRCPILKQELSGQRWPDVEAALMGHMLAAAGKGKGISIETLPTPIRQVGLSCQTAALLNGIQGVAGECALVRCGDQEALRSSSANAAQGVNPFDLNDKSGPGKLNLDIDAVAQVLIGKGVLKDVSGDFGNNPVWKVATLFQENRFFAFSNESAFHATAMLPLSNPSAERFVVEVDSLGCTYRIVSALAFLHLLVRKTPADLHGIFEVQKAEETKSVFPTEWKK